MRIPGREAQTAITCRKRPSRKPCRGHVRVLLTEVPELLHWRCPSCGDEGVLEGWRGNIWDLRGWVEEKEETGRVELSITAEEYEAVRAVVCGPVVLVARAEPLPNGLVLLAGDIGDAEDLVAAIGEVSAAHSQGRRRALLDAVVRRLEEAKRDAISPQSLDAREVAVALAQNHPPDDRMRRLLATLAGTLRVPFEARLGSTSVSIEAVWYVDGDPPELRARTILRGKPVELNLGALTVDLEAGHGVLVSLYRSWWIKQDRHRRRG